MMERSVGHLDRTGEFELPTNGEGMAFALSPDQKWVLSRPTRPVNSSFSGIARQVPSSCSGDSVS